MMLSLVRGAVVLIGALLPGFVRATTAACPPTAVVEGPARLARPIATILRRHGVRSEASPCAGQTVRASVSAKADGGGYRLRVEDRFGRSNEREVQDAETAASLIESWVLDEDADLVAPRGGIAPGATVTAAASTAVSPPAPVRVRLVGVGEVAAAGADGTWLGGSVGGCVAVRRLCIGGRARFAHAARAPADQFFGGELASAEVTSNAVAALASVEVPLGRGRFQVSPRLALGAEWTRTVGALATFSVASERYMLRGEGGFVTTVAVSGSWALVGELTATWGSPLGSPAGQGLEMFLPSPPVVAIRGGLGIGFLR